MATRTKADRLELLDQLGQTFLFKGLDQSWLRETLSPKRFSLDISLEKLYSNRPVYTAFQPDAWLDGLYILLEGGPVIIRSTPLDRIIAISYPGSCFGMRNLPLSYGQVGRSFPSQTEAYKTTTVAKIPLETVRFCYENNSEFQARYDLLFELREKFQYHLLNCSTYPPQSVAALLRGLVYQERALGNQPNAAGVYMFDLAVDLIARACQLNHRTVEQVIKGMQKVGLIEPVQTEDASEDTIRVIDPEGLKETYSATRDKVAWWPLK